MKGEGEGEMVHRLIKRGSKKLFVREVGRWMVETVSNMKGLKFAGEVVQIAC